jgi:hypothetical protein
MIPKLPHELMVTACKIKAQVAKIYNQYILGFLWGMPQEPHKHNMEPVKSTTGNPLFILSRSIIISSTFTN